MEYLVVKYSVIIFFQTAEVDKAKTSFTIEKYDKNVKQFVRVFCQYDSGLSRPLTSCDLKSVIDAKGLLSW